MKDSRGNASITWARIFLGSKVAVREQADAGLQNSHHLERAAGDVQLIFVRRLAAGEHLILPALRQPALTQPSRQQGHRINGKLDELGMKPGFQGSSGFRCCPA